MATTEERLAALEKQMAAWMDQRPTTYYTHQYSGEEIDAATGRALAGGALDTSVTNVSNQLGTFVRPNLLDNWYFGRPVDQRGGYVVPPGVTYTNVTTSEIGTTQTYSAVDRFDGAGKAVFVYNGAVCTCDKTAAVRGYTGNGYGVDRWVNGNASVEIGEGGVKLTSSIYDNNFLQKIETGLWNTLVGKQLTFSVLVKSVEGSWVAASGNNQIWGTITTAGLHSFSASLTNAVSDAYRFVSFGGEQGGNIEIEAAKLELGPTQTLAHQDAAGNWVLNEVPDYGEQLRRCQRYQFEVFDRTFAGQGYLAQVKAIDSTQAYGVLPTPVTMREGGIPALVTDCSAANPYGAFGIYSMGYSSDVGVITGISLFSRVQNGVILRAVGSSFVAGNDYQIWVDNQASHQFLLNLNL